MKVGGGEGEGGAKVAREGWVVLLRREKREWRVGARTKLWLLK